MSTADHQSDEGDPELSILANAFLWDRKVGIYSVIILYVYYTRLFCFLFHSIKEVPDKLR